MFQKSSAQISLLSTDRSKLFFLVVLAFFARIWLIYYLPLIKDEILYAENIHSQISAPSFGLHFLGQLATWKPPLFFLVYAPLVALLQYLPIGFEAVYRLPTVLFGMINILLVYRFLRNISEDKNIAFYTSLIYSMVFLTVYVDSTVLIDTFNLTLILCALCLYTQSSKGSWKYLLAGAVTMLAFFTKLWFAMLVPVLALAFMYRERRKDLFDSNFLVSLLALPLAAILYFVWSSGTSAQDVTPFQVLYDRVFVDGLSANQLLGALHGFFMPANIWIGVGLFGFFRFWKDKPVMTVWAVVSLIPLIAGYCLPWYSLPAMVPLAYFSCLLLLKFDRSVKPDAFFIIVLTILIVAGYMLGFFIWEKYLYDKYEGSREAGTMLAFKDNIAIIGKWDPTLAGYKFLNERRSRGDYLDFGWIVLGDSSLNISLQMIADNYQSMGNFDNNFMCLYMNTSSLSCNYRRTSNVTRPEYVAVVGYENQTLIGFEILFNKSDIKIFKRLAANRT